EMILDKDSQTLARIGDAFETRFQFLNDGRESMLLNQVQQSLFGLEVVVEAGERHAGSARKVAHGSAFVSFFAEDFGGVAEDFAEAAIEAGFGGRGHVGVAAESCRPGSADGGGSGHGSNVRSNEIYRDVTRITRGCDESGRWIRHEYA